MRIAVVGPTYPYKGGIAHHTTELAHRLAKAGHGVELISWSAQYPEVLYPGVQRVPDDQPETPPFLATSYPLSWKNPVSWAFTGARLRSFDRVVLVVVTPIQAPAYLTLLAALGAERRRRTVALCHNVLPHERRFFDLPLTRAVLRRVGHVLVHTEAQANLAGELGAPRVICAEMPPHFPALPKEPIVPGRPLSQTLLFFGLVRPYKGVEVLLRALVQVPSVKLTIAGEIWGGSSTLLELTRDLRIEDRVTVDGGYVPSSRITELFARTDALVLPYRSGTATQNVLLAHLHGVPVIATRVGSLEKQVQHEVDGLLCNPDDVDDLARAIQYFYQPGVAEGLRRGVPAVSTDAEWEHYLPKLILEAPVDREP